MGEPITLRSPIRRNAAGRAMEAAMFALGLAALLVVAWIAYRPGVKGAFLLDDFSNLSTLGATGAVTSWDAFWRYITSGTADPTGRPLSLLTFLIDANDWPADAAAFKVTNILLHLLNGALLCWVMLRLAFFRRIQPKTAATAALMGSGFWLLHPLLVSTTLYVVQREAMLAATFAFAGMLCWCAGRRSLGAGNTVRAMIWMAAGAWGCTLLATLCKPNGMLLPLLLAAAEVTVLRPSALEAPRDRHRRWVINGILLGIPVMLIAIYLAYLLPGLIRTTPGIRGWTIGQRLISEPRVLVDYLRLLWVPSSTSFGVFTDQIRVSASLLQPWTTLPCIVIVSGLVVAGWLTRRRCPIVAFTILFFFAGQFLESSIIPLQLAFEHRNYLPAAFMFWPLALWLSSRTGRPALFRILGTVALCGLAVMTWSRAGVWGNLQLQGRLWGLTHPYSPQAQAFSATVEEAMGDTSNAISQLRDAGRRMPTQPQLALTLISMECRQGGVREASWQMATYSLQHANTGWNNIANWFITAIPGAADHRCKRMTTDRLAAVLAALRSNPSFTRWHRTDPAFERVDAVLALATRKPKVAIANFDEALDADPDPGSLIEQAKALAAYGYPRYALQRLDRHASLLETPDDRFGMARIHARVLHDQNWWPREAVRVRKTLEQDANSKVTP